MRDLKILFLASIHLKDWRKLRNIFATLTILGDEKRVHDLLTYSIVPSSFG
jgi:hypothetical protein